VAAGDDPVRLVLDATAVRAFPHVGVGEPITQVQESGGAFTVPLPVLVACRDLDRRWLNLLLGHPAFRACEMPFAAWQQLSAMGEVLGSLELASALWLATVWRCDVLTSEPKVWAPLGDDPPIVVFR